MTADIDEAIIGRFERWIAHPLIDAGIPLVWQWRIAMVAVLTAAVWAASCGGTIHMWLIAPAVVCGSAQLIEVDWWGKEPSIYLRGSQPNPLRYSSFLRANRLAIYLNLMLQIGALSVWSPALTALFIEENLRGCHPREPRKREETAALTAEHAC